MNWKQHLAVGIPTGILFIVLSTWRFGWFDSLRVLDAFLLVFVLFLSPLLPDLDHPRSKLHAVFMSVGLSYILLGGIGYYFIEEYAIASITLLLGGSILVVLTEVLARGFKHRGFTHSLPVCFAYAGVIGLISLPEIGVLAGLGFYSHLAADGLFFKIY